MTNDRPAVRVGAIFDNDESTPHWAAMLKTEPDKTLLEIPLLRGVTSQLEKLVKELKAPQTLTFVDTFGQVALCGIRVLTYTSGSPVSVAVLEIDQVVHCGPRVPDFTLVHGVRSEINGLPRWMDPGVFRHKVNVDNDGRITGAEFEVKSVPAETFPSVDGLTLAPHFRVSHQWSDGIHTIRETTQVETTYPDPKSWSEHIRVHRAIQDLVCLAFWRRCDLTVMSARRDDDPTVTMDNADHGVEWRDARVLNAGRGVMPHPAVRLNDRLPLFFFNEIGVAGVEKWFREYDDLGQAMWVLSASLFRSGGTVEVQLLQVGTALEALGYELAVRANQIARGGKDRTFTMVKALELVCNSTDCDLSAVLDGLSVAGWSKAFNEAYKGVKHADNPLPDPNMARDRSAQGALLARLWLARNLGMDRTKLEERIPSQL